MKPEYLTVQQAADILGVHRATIYRWLEPKRDKDHADFVAEEIAGHTLIRASVVNRKLKQHKGSQ